MKQIITEFLRKGVIAGGFGPIVLGVLYLILQQQDAIQTLTVHQVCLGVASLYALAFIVGGMNVIYQIEQLPLMVAIFIHGSVLYVSHLITYLVNDWLDWGTAPVLVFTCVFVIGYLLIWAIIYSIIKRNTDRINEVLKRKQQPTK